MRSEIERLRRAAAPAALLLLATVEAAWAYGPGATAAEAVSGGLRAVFGHGSFLALLIAGFWIGRADDPGRPVLAAVAGLLGGIGLGWALGAPPYLDSLIAASGLVAALLLTAGRGGAGLGAALVAGIAGLFGAGLGTTLSIDAAPGGYVAAYFLTFLGLVLALLSVGALTARLLRRRSAGKPARILAGWAAAMSVLLVALGLLPNDPAISGDAIDLRVADSDPNPDQLRALVHDILQTIYLAYEEQDEEAIYDRLATVADGETLVNLYLQKREALALEASGGATSELLAIEVDSVAELPSRGAGQRVQGTWTVRGAYGHWGHTHERLNRYAADLELVPVDGVWKIAGFELRDMARVDQAAAEP